MTDELEHEPGCADPRTTSTWGHSTLALTCESCGARTYRRNYWPSDRLSPEDPVPMKGTQPPVTSGKGNEPKHHRTRT